jgi:predicted nucleic acid-binding protein
VSAARFTSGGLSAIGPTKTDVMRIAIDTNVLVYAEDLDDTDRGIIARNVLSVVASQHRPVFPVQVLGELFRTLRRKTKVDPENAALIVRRWRDFADLKATDPETFEEALSISENHKLDIWDAVIVAAAQQAGCGLLLSEDLQDGFVWRGLTVANPFAEPLHPLLASILDP